MKRFLVFTASLILIFALLLVGVRLFALSLPLPSDLSSLTSSNCDKPCWFDVRPGQTKPMESVTYLRTRASLQLPDIWPSYLFRLCWTKSERTSWEGCLYRKMYSNLEKPVLTIELTSREQIMQFGDAIALWGTPISAELCRIPRDSVSFMDIPFTLVADAYFKGNIYVRFYDPHQFRPLRIDPRMSVRRIVYYSTGGSRYNASALRPWYGFVRPSEIHDCQN